ncbi:MAG TPA: hypothetical protein VML54_02345 [Candidatus Limnocylindrales bacterium]|nr:hypothetical protein [Candidatus Limnocylindrales bacterium]
MGRARRVWVVAGVAASFLAVGVPYWAVPYGAVSLPGTLLGPGLVVVAATAGLLRGFGAARSFAIVASVAASPPAAVVARVVVETQRDPTSHNLWPFEVVIALGLGLLCASAGVVAGAGARLVALHMRRHEPRKG